MFMEGALLVAGGDFFVGEGGKAAEMCVTSADGDLGMVSCESTTTGGAMVGRELMISDLLIGF